MKNHIQSVKSFDNDDETELRQQILVFNTNLRLNHTHPHPHRALFNKYIDMIEYIYIYI